MTSDSRNYRADGDKETLERCIVTTVKIQFPGRLILTLTIFAVNMSKMIDRTELTAPPPSRKTVVEYYSEAVALLERQAKENPIYKDDALWVGYLFKTLQPLLEKAVDDQETNPPPRLFAVLRHYPNQEGRNNEPVGIHLGLNLDEPVNALKRALEKADAPLRTVLQQKIDILTNHSHPSESNPQSPNRVTLRAGITNDLTQLGSTSRMGVLIRTAERYASANLLCLPPK